MYLLSRLPRWPRKFTRRGQRGKPRRLRVRSSLVALVSLLIVIGAARAEQGSMSVQLNKVEPQGQGCRTYFVITNKGAAAYEILKLDLIVFRPDGVIGRRFAADLGPIKPNKRTVKLFDLDDTSCDQIGSILINEVLDCKVGDTQKPDCLADITPSSLAKAQLTK
jgi:hypothetical protein